MIIQSGELNNGDTLEADICVVGGGPAGITFAREFINTNHNVIMLESGDLKPDSEHQLLKKSENFSFKSFDLDKARCRAFGGTSHLWHIELNEYGKQGVRLRPLDAIDFEKRDWIPNSGWPIEKSDLDPYYKKAQKVFNIGPYRYDAEYWIKGQETEQVLLNKGNIQTTVFQFAEKDIFYSGNKSDIEKSDHIQIYLNATVLKLNVNEYANSVEDLEVSTSNGKMFTVSANYYLLANGGLEIPRLMLLSNDIMHSGVGNQNDLVGRFFMEHFHLKGAVFYPKDLRIFNQQDFYKIHQNGNSSIMGKLALRENVIREEKLLNVTASLHHLPMAKLYKAEKGVRKVLNKVRKRTFDQEFVDGFKTVLKNPGILSYVALRKLLNGDKNEWYDTNYKYHGFLLRLMCEQLPDPESRVTLGSSRDRFGQNKIKLDWNVTSSNIKDIRRFLEILGRELHRCNLGKLDIRFEGDKIPNDLHGGYHHMGTTRMDSNPQKGVVNEHCRVHGLNNLFVASSSVFPTVGYANPTLTIAALSLRVADRVKQCLKD